MNVLKPYGTTVGVFQRVADALIMILALYTVNRALDHDWRALNNIAAISAVALFLVGGQIRRLYASWRLSSLDDEFMSVLLIWGISCCALIVGAFLSKMSSSYSRLEMTTWFLVTPAALIASRLIVRALLRSMRAAGKNTRTVAVAGAGPLAASIMKHLEEPATFGMRLIGVFDDRSLERIRG